MVYRKEITTWLRLLNATSAESFFEHGQNKYPSSFLKKYGGDAVQSMKSPVRQILLSNGDGFKVYYDTCPECMGRFYETFGSKGV